MIVSRYPNKTEAEAKAIIRAWTKSGLLVSKDYPNPKTRKDEKVSTSPTKRGRRDLRH